MNNNFNLGRPGFRPGFGRPGFGRPGFGGPGFRPGFSRPIAGGGFAIPFILGATTASVLSPYYYRPYPYPYYPYYY